jgi:hypothetical protein
MKLGMTMGFSGPAFDSATNPDVSPLSFTLPLTLVTFLSGIYRTE